MRTGSDISGLRNTLSSIAAFRAASVELDSITCMVLLKVSLSMSSPFNIQHDGTFTNPQLQKIHRNDGVPAVEWCSDGVPLNITTASPPLNGVTTASRRRAVIPQRLWRTFKSRISSKYSKYSWQITSTPWLTPMPLQTQFCLIFCKILEIMDMGKNALYDFP